MRSLRNGLAVLSLFLLGAGQAQAAIIGVDFTGGTAPSPVNQQTLGWQFTLSTTKIVTSLGVWEENPIGLNENHLVGIWNPSGGLLTSATVTNASVPLASTASNGRWLFESLTIPLTLVPGTYIIGADYPTGNDVVRTSVATLSTAPGLAFVQGRFVSTPTSGFDFPDSTFATTGGHFGPNLLLTDSISSVPEPASFTLLALGALGVAGYSWRWRLKASR